MKFKMLRLQDGKKTAALWGSVLFPEWRKMDPVVGKQRETVVVQLFPGVTHYDVSTNFKTNSRRDSELPVCDVGLKLRPHI